MDKIIYEILMDLKINRERFGGTEEIKIPQYTDYNIGRDEFGKVILEMEEMGVVKASYSIVKSIPRIIHSLDITENGLRYLKENSKLNKAVTMIKEIKDVIK